MLAAGTTCCLPSAKAAGTTWLPCANAELQERGLAMWAPEGSSEAAPGWRESMSVLSDCA